MARKIGDFVHKGDTKPCGGCKQTLPFAAFGFHTKTGRPRSRCKKCSVAGKAEWRRKNPNRDRTGERLSNKKMREARTYEKAQDLQLRAAFGLSYDTFLAIFKHQGNACAICKKKDKEDCGQRFAVDHDHEMNAIRGILCRNCNTGIGLLQDSPKIIYNAFKYLEKFQPIAMELKNAN